MKNIQCNLFLFTFLLTVLLITGCASSANTVEMQPKNESASNTDSMQITIAGASAGGLWSAVGEGIGQAISRDNPGTNFTYQPGQLGPNVITVSSGRTNYGMEALPSLVLAERGEEPFESEITNLRAISVLFVSPYQFMVTKESGITAIEDIKSKEIGTTMTVHTKDSPLEILNRVIFDAYEFSYKDITRYGGEIVYLPSSQAVDMVRDGKMHAQAAPMPSPASIYTELSMSKDITILALNEKAIKKAEEELGVTPYTIPKSDYAFLEEDVKTVGMNTVFFTREDVPEEEVYKITKSFYENLDFLYEMNAVFKDVTDENILDVGVPLHPGAERFYKEIGLLK
ncbi:TAXI family TRAP transporter solute-binding subunit [Halalkalibacterium ligniniphilum]|uniref:TAXI family TRAP transporter solute-binding subunit n=1 Tax=Halalkalibacterium ligniniphilum TaxID=1134413 RepID=UPI000346543B|nr:TAXI family TRAP transporter solute-binding subunit [Halalkalibacterium ligniniphilum]